MIEHQEFVAVMCTVQNNGKKHRLNCLKVMKSINTWLKKHFVAMFMQILQAKTWLLFCLQSVGSVAVLSSCFICIHLQLLLLFDCRTLFAGDAGEDVIQIISYQIYIYIYIMDVSKNRGTPKSSILIWFFIINHPFWGTPFLETPIHKYIS